MKKSAKNNKYQSLVYWVFVLFVAGVSLAAYTGYQIYPRFDLPAVTGIALLVLAFGAGVASFFAPCSFPLLVTLLSLEVGAQEGDNSTEATTGRDFIFASALSLGAATFLLMAGIVLALGGHALFAGFTFTSPQAMIARVVVGIILIFLGLIQLEFLSNRSFRLIEGLAKPFRTANARLRRKYPLPAIFIYGFGYLIAGFG